MGAQSIAFLFPGQGSQSVGMGRDLHDGLAAAAEVFERADAALGVPLSRLCFEGPEEELQLTANTQPAILTTSIAALRHLEAAGIEPSLVAGHSLGEYSALVAAGALDFEDAVRLVRRRGEAMQQAVPVGEGAMAAVLGLGAADVERVTAAAARDCGAVCSVANLNAPEQIVIAGARAAVERACELAAEAGAKRTVMLPVSAPFHSPLMAPAREAMRPLLEQAEIRDPKVPVVCNVDAEALTAGDAIRDALVRQVDSPVRWVESMQVIVRRGVDQALEVGPGMVLTGLARRIDRQLGCSPAGTTDAIAKAVANLSSAGA
ncbi:MAG: [acyl-carrier-protein] S-malonyltransferase [Acidobacteria bacterium]|nr:MAG: [acyl-carrier-protein] S-malonyltransferase [Acidobacteriota bacterium]REK08685.1 MAG: [acyl-carrier-protein] S-malonyltransferase [Acidobacteriota bacterium]